MPGPELYVGLMSGTSMDGVDAVLARSHDDRFDALAHRHAPFAPALREELMALNAPSDNELHRAALAANGVARAYAALVATLLDEAGVARDAVKALGAHGQTVRHRPGEFDGCGYTTQLLNGALLAELTGVDVVCDLRSRDVAAGGQGAPLVPAFHRAVFAQPGREIAVLNIGGIANVSLLGASQGGFDTGPGNCLMDLWILEHHGEAYDADGAWAAGGRVIPGLLATLLAEPWFALAPPRSTGRDLFNRAWLARALDQHGEAAPQDVQATLLELTARSIVDTLPARLDELLVCGGGALNGALMARLRALRPRTLVQATEARGLPAMQVEAAAFAWLAMRFKRGLPGNLPTATGAAGSRLLGALYPA
ncbi:MAG: anhydro-N-acetylmuramic acid kinase [Pelomonas sp.]|nr:anhydro-N-acetylmuramic acid kinase [Roseateles sp.]